MSSLVSDESDSFGRDLDRQLCPDSACVGVLDEDLVCPECGTIAETDAPILTSEDESSAVNMLHRKLCRDGACIGLLGPDGCCRECGLVGDEVTTDPRLRGLKAIDAPEERAVATPVPPSLSLRVDDASAVSDDDEGPPEFSNRRLCPDGSCIGLIGSAGSCNACGLIA